MGFHEIIRFLPKFRSSLETDEGFAESSSNINGHITHYYEISFVASGVITLFSL